MIVVTGAPRSGTSMVCQVLEALGVDFGKHLQKPGTANPYGFYENLQVRRGVTKPWLKRLGADAMGQWPLPDRTWRPSPVEVETFRLQMAEALDGADAVKDPKLLLLWPLVHAAFPNARWVLVRRDETAIAESCQRTGFMRLHDTVDGWLEWIGLLGERMTDLRCEVDAVEVWPDPDDVEVFADMAGALGLVWDERRARKVLHPESWRAA